MNCLKTRKSFADNFLTRDDTELFHQCVKIDGWMHGLERFFCRIPFDKASSISNILDNRQVCWKFLLDLDKEKKALVFDSTIGTLSLSLARHFKKVYSIIFNPLIAGCVKQRLYEEGITNVEIVEIDRIETLFIEGFFFDLIVMHNMEDNLLSLMEEDGDSCKTLEGFLDLLSKMASPGASLFLSFSNKYSYTLLLKRNNDTPRDKEWVRFKFGHWTIKKFLKRLGFPHIETFTVYPTLENPREIVRSGGIFPRGAYSGTNFLKKFIMKSGFLAPAFLVIASRMPLYPYIQCLREEGLKYPNLSHIWRRYEIGGGHAIVSFINEIFADQKGVIIKLPLGHTHVGCKERIEILEDLHKLDNEISEKIPEPIGSMEFRGQVFSVERIIQGVAVDYPTDLYNEMMIKAADFLIKLHRATGNQKMVDAAIFDKIFRSLLSGLIDPGSGKKDVDIIRLGNYLRSMLMNRQILFVWEHGDFKLENLLFDLKKRSINGVIDWDLFKRDGLPLIDLFHLIASRGKVFEKRSLEYVILEKMIPLNFNEEEDALINNYIQTLRIEKDLLPIFIIAYWLHHVTVRTRWSLLRSHPEWVQINIMKPLGLISNLYLQKNVC